jgi:hypothetical protein
MANGFVGKTRGRFNEVNSPSVSNEHSEEGMPRKYFKPCVIMQNGFELNFWELITDQSYM